MRTKREFYSMVLPALIAGILVGTAARAADDRSALGIHQEGVRQSMAQLERRIVSLITVFKEADPELAGRLHRALALAKQRQVTSRMNEIKDLLDRGALDPAVKEQTAIDADLERLLRILLYDQSEYERLKEEIERLRRWEQRLQKLAREEWDQKRDSEDTQDPNAAEKQADRAALLEQLIARQKELNAATERTLAKGGRDLARLSGDQSEARSEAAELLSAMRQESGSSQRPGAPVMPEPGETALGEAIAHQGKAAANLAQQKGKSAKQEQERALAGLERALAEMRGAQEEWADRPEDPFPQMQQRQDGTAGATGQLEQEMAQAAGQPQPGQQSLASAQRHMQQASGQLGAQRPRPAAEEQEEAFDDLVDAQRELLAEIARLEALQREALLAELERMLRDMLMRQQKASADTLDLDGKRAKNTWQRAEQLACLAVQKEESQLDVTAGRALQMIAENGSSSVFNAILEEVRALLKVVVERLGKEDTGTATQLAQAEIEQLLGDLLQALEDNRELPPPSDNQQQQPLISLLAELKLLRSTQARINEGTTRVDKAAAAGEIAGQEHGRLTSRLAGRQRQVHRMTNKLLGQPQENRP